MTEEERYALRTATLKNKTTVQDVLYEAAKRYIANNVGDNGMWDRTPNDDLREAMNELESGKGKRFSSIAGLMADLRDDNHD
jgi:hypothetical protein